ncbi:hypothetical protein [Nesterenkonia flava]|uniref:DUF559 domain-containing protein n=1 Tax=Nesterenkonia flava TaxID=469799 RepID=A0ABU1FQ70_9MICC|nr:hypothetical protein [Nesterenkonia flava]MDR5710799.1 hypothetical protein [Nesterenkonia flava]
MTRPRQLPPHLAARGFTMAQLRSAGESPDRATRRDVVRVGSGVYLARHVAETLDDDGVYRLQAVAVALDAAGARLSHVTAARLWGFPLPGALRRDPRVHLSYGKQTRTVMQRSGVVSHRLSWAGAGAVTRDGALVSRPEEVFAELAALLSVEALVVLGDHLVRVPYGWAEGRAQPHIALPALRDFVASRHFRGKRRALRALAAVRIGSDSAKETRFRLAVVRAGLPEPQLQVPLNPADPRSRKADAGYPGSKIALQYDGSSHFTPEGARRDQRRDNEFAAAGWRVLRVNVEDDREDFRTAISHLGAMLAAGGVE